MTALDTDRPSCIAANVAFAKGDRVALDDHVRHCEACAALGSVVPWVGPPDDLAEYDELIRRAIETRQLVLSRYRIHSVIARGGQGIVCRAEDAELGTLAIKIVGCRAARDGRLPEGRIASKLAGRGVCRIFTIERHGGVRLIVMELVEGECLEDALPRLSPPQRLAILRGVCAAVADIHRAGVVHLDLKPRNIVLRADDEPVVTDFGVAVLLEADGHALPLGHTRKYAPREQLDGKPVDRRADVYALGVTLRELVPDGPAHVRGVIARATSDDPALRHPDAAAVLADLDRPARRRRFLVRTVAPVAALALAGGGVAYAVTRSHANTKPDVVIDFDDVETAGKPLNRVSALDVLAGAGITAEMSPKTELVVANTLAFYDGQAIRPSSAPNVLAHVGSNNPLISFTLKLARPAARVTFRRAALIAATKSGVTFPKWTAIAFDAGGAGVAGDGEETFGSYDDVPARDVVLEGGCISRIRFESVNGIFDDAGQYKAFAAFSAIVLDDLTLTYGGC